MWCGVSCMWDVVCAVVWRGVLRMCCVSVCESVVCSECHMAYHLWCLVYCVEYAALCVLFDLWCVQCGV